ncbi:hypothetical protein [Dokdonella sp.]|jgi:hypothetical protein
MNKHTVSVGSDGHKESIEISLTDARVGGEVRHDDRVGGEAASLEHAKCT